MTILANAKHERFAQALAQGKTRDNAYAEAGYSRHDSNAARLSGNDRIISRVAELQERGAIRAEVSVQSLLDELEEARELAKAQGQPAAMVAASMGKGKVAGLIVDRQERGKAGDFDGMSADERRAVGDAVRRELARRGLSAGDAATPKPN